MKIYPGLKVKVVRDNGTQGMLISNDVLKLRSVGKFGEIVNYVPGHGGDVWYVRQDDGISAYSYDELEVVS